jgi:hypothetical protein
VSKITAIKTASGAVYKPGYYDKYDMPVGLVSSITTRNIVMKVIDSYTKNGIETYKELKELHYVVKGASSSKLIHHRLITGVRTE